MYCCTSRASEGRGSSLTLGKIWERDTRPMTSTRRKVKVGWRLHTELQPAVLGMEALEEIERFQGPRLREGRSLRRRSRFRM
jgi:hypothetical protein